MGRGGVVAPPAGFLPELARLAREHGALFVADEVWTGLGRAGSWLSAHSEGVVPDLICLGKGLGGGLPLSAVIGSAPVMQSWRREAEVVHTATFAGAPLAASAAIATLDVLSRQALPERAQRLGARYADELRQALAGSDKVRGVRGRGFMLGIDLGERPGAASQLMKRLLEAGYITSTGGGQREVLVLCRYHDLPFSEIGAILGCTTGAARVRAHRALAALREAYRKLDTSELRHGT